MIKSFKNKGLEELFYSGIKKCIKPSHSSKLARILDTPVEFRIGALELAKPLLLWVNDGLMTIFFFLISLDLKREILEGELSDKRKILLPGLGAIGGMALPALIYTYFNFADSTAMNGWAIPAVTSLPFSLGILITAGLLSTRQHKNISQIIGNIQ